MQYASIPNAKGYNIVTLIQFTLTQSQISVQYS